MPWKPALAALCALLFLGGATTGFLFYLDHDQTSTARAQLQAEIDNLQDKLDRQQQALDSRTSVIDQQQSRLDALRAQAEPGRSQISTAAAGTSDATGRTTAADAARKQAQESLTACRKALQEFTEAAGKSGGVAIPGPKSDKVLWECDLIDPF